MNDHEEFEAPKTHEQIEAEEAKLTTQVWYNRCYLAVLAGVMDGTEKRPHNDIWNAMKAHALKAETEYPDIAIQKLNERELGRIEGQLYALLCVIGNELL